MEESSLEITKGTLIGSGSNYRKDHLPQYVELYGGHLHYHIKYHHRGTKNSQKEWARAKPSGRRESPCWAPVELRMCESPK